MDQAAVWVAGLKKAKKAESFPRIEVEMSEKRGRGRPKKPARLKKDAMYGVRLTPHQVAILATLSQGDETHSATLERFIAESLTVLVPEDALYFSAEEARSAGSALPLDGLPVGTIFRARPSARPKGFWKVWEHTGDDATPWRRVGAEWRTEQLPIHEDEFGKIE